MTATMNRTRFEPFSDDELVGLWRGITTDDGIQYGIGREDPMWLAAVQMREEAVRRGLAHSPSGEWEHVL